MLSDAKGEFQREDRFVLMNDAYSGDCGYPSTVMLMDGQALTLLLCNLSERRAEVEHSLRRVDLVRCLQSNMLVQAFGTTS